MLARELDNQIAMDHRRWDRQHDEAAIRLARECGDAALDFCRVPDTNGTYLDPERWRCALDGAKLTDCGCIRHISQHCRSRHLGRDLFEQLQPFDGHAKFGRGEPGGVAARARQAIDNTCPDRIRDQYEHDRHGACCLALMLGGADVRMTSGASATSSIAYLRKRSASPAAHRTSMLTLRPTAQPASCRPCRNAATRLCPSGSSAAKCISTPMRRMRSPCCARAASGQAAAARPTSVMNSRRFTRSPRRRA